MKTKHLTIMFTDIKGFTSKTSKSSREELHKLLDLHDQLIIPIFKKFNGRVVKTIGDAFMVAFQSPTDAVLCGMEIQNVLAKHNEKLDEEKKLEVRVAVNSGEITIKGKDIFGEAVNVASRLESIAEPGDIYFTESVYLSMNKNEIPTAEVGHRHFKGIPEEVKVYKVLRERKKKKKGMLFSKPEKREYVPKKRGFPKVIRWVAVIFIILIIAILFIEVNKQREEKEFFQRELKSIQKEDVRQELEMIFHDVQNAIDEGDEKRAEKGIEELSRRSKELNHPPELEDAIHELRFRFNERFR